MNSRKLRRKLAAARAPVVRRETRPFSEGEGGTWDCRCGETGIPFWRHPVICPACGRDVRGLATTSPIVTLTRGDGTIQVRRGSKGEELLRRLGWKEAVAS